MKAIGYVRCLECGGVYRGYAPRHWKHGDQLCAWKHTWEDGSMFRCPGSYKPGHESRLDTSDNNTPDGGTLLEQYWRGYKILGVAK